MADLKKIDNVVLCVDVYGECADDNPKTTRAIRFFARRARETGNTLVLWTRMQSDWPQTPTRISDDGTTGIKADTDLSRDPAPVGDWGLDKPDYDSFLGTGLKEFIEGLGAKNVYVMGFRASLCAGQAAETAKKLGFNTIAVSDLMANIEDILPGFSDMELLRGQGVTIMDRHQALAKLGLSTPPAGSTPPPPAPKR